MKQLQYKIENVKRSTTPKIRKRRDQTDDWDTDEISLEKRAAIQDMYGCINWHVKFLPLGETSERLEKKKGTEDDVSSNLCKRRGSQASNEIHFLHTT